MIGKATYALHEVGEAICGDKTVPILGRQRRAPRDVANTGVHKKWLSKSQTHQGGTREKGHGQLRKECFEDCRREAVFLCVIG